MRVELVYFTGCPNVPATRELLRRCLGQLGVRDEIIEINTDTATVPDTYRRLGSPTVLIDGADVLGNHIASAESCRLHLPTEAELLSALRGHHEK